MNIKREMIVKATAGRDSGRYFVILKNEDRFVFIADGKTRKLESPKRKNIKHLKLTDKTIGLDNITDKKLRNVLGKLAGTP